MKMISGKTKIYTVFLSSGVQHLESTDLKPSTNEEILGKLRSECEGVDFVVGSPTVGAEKLKQEFDGVLIFGGLENYKIALTGLPTIIVYNFPEFLHIPHELFREKGKILTACLDRPGTCSPDITSSMFDDLVEKIRLIQALTTIKESTILSVTDSPYVTSSRGDLTHTYDGDIRQLSPQEHNDIFLKAVKETLGANVTKIGTAEISIDEDIQNIDQQKAEEIAKIWLDESKGMKDTIESEVVKSGRMYLAMRILMDKYGASAIATHIRSLVRNPAPEDMVWPSLGNSELQKNGIVGCCQSHINVVLTHMLAQYAFGRSSMMGDFIVEPFNNVSILMHCGGPWNPRGLDDRVPYIIRDHAERRTSGHLKVGGGACSEVLYPAGEPATIWRIDVQSKLIQFHTGVTVDPYSIYKGFDYLMCRTKLVIRTDAAKVQRYVYPDKRGVHRSGTFGDHRERIKDLAVLMGFDVIEEDR